MVSKASLEEKDVRLRVVDHVLHPAGALLDSKLPPLCLRHKSAGRNFFVHILHYNTTLYIIPQFIFGAFIWSYRGKNNVPVLVGVISVFITVNDFFAWHFPCGCQISEETMT